MLKSAHVALAAGFAAAMALSGAALAKDPVNGNAAAAPGQTKAQGQPAAPAAKPATTGQGGVHTDNLGQTASSDCAKLADPKTKDDCVKKAQAATGASAKTKPN